jgi:hypothetical protein
VGAVCVCVDICVVPDDPAFEEDSDWTRKAEVSKKILPKTGSKNINKY